ncbi:hypothetical protein GDO81_004570 [Engystomops pustulosus]|uniref:WAP domain-containing protein n=1 Tax=Engystomops pustulosus TaxID=76066 RepID=A0AAV6ZTN5_ENGPU|nr:hypothetical protein GDO81_004570 [Engystomops pustulosus]
MRRALIICALLAVALCHDSSEESDEYIVGKRGMCPNVSSNISAAACASPCAGGINCTLGNCSSDTNCTGAQKCCDTGCGLMCVDPEFKTVCSEDEDCPVTLVCCKRSCVTSCGKGKPPKKHEKNHRRKEDDDDSSESRGRRNLIQ